MSKGTSVECPDGTCGRMAPQSGLAVKHGIDTLGGVIDKDFRGELKAILMNHGEQDLSIKTGDCTAQTIFEQNSNKTMEEVTSLTSTERQDKGFGNTGTSEQVETLDSQTQAETLNSQPQVETLDKKAGTMRQTTDAET